LRHVSSHCGARFVRLIHRNSESRDARLPALLGFELFSLPSLL